MKNQLDRSGRHEGGTPYQLVLLAGDVRDIHVVGRGAKFFELLAGEDVDSDKVDLGVTVLASLGGRHVDDLAGAVLDHDETVLSQGRALHRESGRGAGVGGLEGVLMLREAFRSVTVYFIREDGRGQRLSRHAPSRWWGCGVVFFLGRTYLGIVRHLE